MQLVRRVVTRHITKVATNAFLLVDPGHRLKTDKSKFFEVGDAVNAFSNGRRRKTRLNPFSSIQLERPSHKVFDNTETRSASPRWQTCKTARGPTRGIPPHPTKVEIPAHPRNGASFDSDTTASVSQRGKAYSGANRPFTAGPQRSLRGHPSRRCWGVILKRIQGPNGPMMGVNRVDQGKAHPAPAATAARARHHDVRKCFGVSLNDHRNFRHLHHPRPVISLAIFPAPARPALPIPRSLIPCGATVIQFDSVGAGILNLLDDVVPDLRL